MPARNAGKTPKTGKSPKESAQSPQNDGRVELKPLFGLAPGKYLFALYLTGVLALLFAVLFLPGILNPGTRLRISSLPQGAAVRVDDIYRGTSPCTVFLPKGSRRITIVAPGFKEFDIAMEAKARIFASLFRPAVALEEAVLVPEAPFGALVDAAAEYAAWSLTGKPDESRQIPLVFSDAAWRMGPYIMDKADDSRALLHAAARFARWPAQQRDLLRAAFLVDSAGLPPSPLTALATTRSLLRWLSDTPGAALALAESVQADAREQLLQSAWYAKAASGVVMQPPNGQSNGKRLRLEGIVFSGIDSGEEAPWWIAQREVSLAEWDAFIADNPAWSRTNLDELLAAGLVTADYLEGFQGVPVPGKARHSVSWHAARAFCAWLGERLPQELADYEVRLPRDHEWSVAARLARALELEDMDDGLWEWCEDPWTHYPDFPATHEAAEALGSPLRSLRGGSWANRSGGAVKDERGAQLPQTCSPFTGFRPVVVRKQVAR